MLFVIVQRGEREVNMFICIALSMLSTAVV